MCLIIAIISGFLAYHFYMESQVIISVLAAVVSVSFFSLMIRNVWHKKRQRRAL